MTAVTIAYVVDAPRHQDSAVAQRGEVMANPSTDAEAVSATVSVVTCEKYRSWVMSPCSAASSPHQASPAMAARQATTGSGVLERVAGALLTRAVSIDHLP